MKPKYDAKRAARLKLQEKCLRKKKVEDQIKAFNLKTKEEETNINEFNKDVQKVFEDQARKEVKIKNFISTLNEKLLQRELPETENEKKVMSLYDDLLKSIDDLQKKIMVYVEISKLEMKDEITKMFDAAEQAQKDLMDKKMKEQKKVFEKMISIRNQLKKIQKDFDDTNRDCELLVKRNEELKVNFDTSKATNTLIEDKLIELQKENDRISLAYKEYLNKRKLKEQSQSDLGNESKLKSAKEILGEDSKYLKTASDIPNKAEILQKELKKEKLKYKTVYDSFIEKQKEKTDLTILIQKCIEDMSIELRSVKNEIKSFKLHNKPTEELDEIQIELERKLKILSYIYDNGLKIKKKPESINCLDVNDESKSG